MKILLAMIKREYWVRARKPGFIIGTILTPLMWAAAIFIPVILLSVGGRPRQIIILDQSGDPHLFEAIGKALPSDSLGRDFALTHEIIPDGADIEQEKVKRNALLEMNSRAASIVLRKGILDGVAPEYYAKNIADLSISTLSRSIGAAIAQRRLVKAGLDPEAVSILTNQVEMKTFKVSAEGETQGFGQSLMMSIVVLLTMFFSVLGHSTSVLAGVVEEKESRIIEVLMTSVEPYQIMTSKLLGIGLVGLTQFAIWGVCAFLLRLLTGSMLSEAGVSLPVSTVSLLFYCSLLFLLGYFLFSSLYLIVGAVSSKTEEANQWARPIVLLNLLPLFIFWTVLNDPDSKLSVVLSMIPFLTPTIMSIRLAIGDVTVFQFLLAAFLTLSAIIAAAWIAGRLYRTTILLYGKRPTLAEIGHWLRYS